MSTFTFGLAASQYFYRRPILAGNSESVHFTRGNFFGLDVKRQHAYYYLVLVVLIIFVMIIARLRKTRVLNARRSGVRDNPNTRSPRTRSERRQ